MVEAFKSAFKNYANFKDRTSRSGYWYFQLANFIIGFVIGFVAGVTGINEITYVSFLYELVILIPGIAITVRRLHDVNKSGWCYFIALIPFVGWILLLVWLCTASVNENNKYGQQV